MNYFVMSTNRATIAVHLSDDRTDRCEHVAAGAPCYATHGEFDSFGPVDIFAACEACHKKEIARQADESESCSYCKKHFRRADLNSWTPYDFDRAAGEEPSLVCEGCWDGPEFTAVRARDAKDAAFEDESSPVVGRRSTW